MRKCVIEPVTVMVGYDGPITDLMCLTCEAPAPGGRCLETGLGLAEDHPRHLINTYLREEKR